MNYDIQLYSVRDLTEKDLALALDKVAELGYRSVEFAGFFGHSASEVRAMLDNSGLNVSGTHTGLNLLTERYNETVEFHKGIGCDTIIIPWADLFSRGDTDAFISVVNDLQPRLKKDGIRLCYHNHEHEFRAVEDGFVPYDAIVEKTELLLELDTYWAFVAGRNPVEMLQSLKDRIPVIHIKDGSPDGKGKPLGMGQAPVKAVYDKAKELGMHMVVESETLTPDGITEAKICIEYLKGLEK